MNEILARKPQILIQFDYDARQLILRSKVSLEHPAEFREFLPEHDQFQIAKYSPYRAQINAFRQRSYMQGIWRMLRQILREIHDVLQ